MSTLWIVPPLLDEPSAEALTSLQRSPLFARADMLARERTHAGLLAVTGPTPQADWARARLRALASCLAQAGTRLAQGAPAFGFAGIGLGEIGAWALCGLLQDETALEVMLETALALAREPQGFSVLAFGVPDSVSAPGVELARLGESDRLAEGDPDSIGTLLARLHEAGARVAAPWQGPVFAAARARASRAALAAAAPRPARVGWLRSSSSGREHTLPDALSSEPFDLMRLWRLAMSLGCTRCELWGENLGLSLPHAPTSARKAAPAPTKHGYYIGEVRERSASAFMSERVLSLEAEPYLVTAARLHTTSVLPGSFELEIGVEAGKLLHPELVPVSIDNALFHSALKLFEGQPVTMRLKTKSQPLEDGRYSVALSITSDLIHKTGRMLQADRKHCDLTVIMGPRFEPAPALLAFDEASSVAEPDVPAVLYQSGSPLWLGPYFEAVWDTRRSGNVVRSVYRNPADLSLAAFGEHFGAPCLMDAVLQNPLRRNGPYLAVGIPDSIRSVRFFDLVNEREILERHGHLILSSVVDDALPYCELMQVSTPDGRVVLEVERFALIPLGWIDRRDLSVHAELPVMPAPYRASAQVAPALGT